MEGMTGQLDFKFGSLAVPHTAVAATSVTAPPPSNATGTCPRGSALASGAKVGSAGPVVSRSQPVAATPTGVQLGCWSRYRDRRRLPRARLDAGADATGMPVGARAPS
jgi:hypothetical protein